MKINVRLAKFIMTRFQTFPVFDKNKVGLLQEVFHHPEFLNSSQEEKLDMMLRSSQSKYDNEMNFPIDKYFGFNLIKYLKDKVVLDLGCFVGGRSIAWLERYQIKKLYGIDISDTFITAANQFAEKKGLHADFKKAFGEKLPYEDETFDVIMTFDVFEHVQNLEETVKECQRVLKPGGRLIAVFPSYYHLIEHHLSLVTRFPGLHYVFSGKTLVRAYYEILQERGKAAEWYKRDTPELRNWEKGNTINGSTSRKFRKILKKQGWKVLFQSRKPVGGIGRSIEKRKWLRIFSIPLIPFTYIPFLQEFALQRIAVVAEKKK